MALPLVQLKHVTVIAGGQTLLRDLSLTVRPGEALRLTGPNGGGKTTLLRLLAGEVAPVGGTRRYALGGEWQPSAVQARRTLSVVGPDAEAFYLTRDWEVAVRDVLLAGAEGEHLRLWEATREQLARLEEVTALTGLEPLLERDFRTLSHGQRRRALLARALMPQPALLLLDEFTDGLSEAARAELGDVLREVHASGVALVLATHRPEEVPEVGWRTVWVEGGGVVEGREWREEGKEQKPSARTFFSPLHPSPSPLIQLHHAQVFRNGHRALGPLSWTWETGQHWLVTGENGSGKSTLLRLIAGELHPALGGEVRRPFLTRDVLSERRRHIGLVSAEVGIRQRVSLSGREWTGRDVLASAFAGTEGFAEAPTPEQARAVDALAERLDLQDLLPRPAETLSQGQLRRLLLARAALPRPRLLLLDEGLDFVDARSRALFLSLLPELVAGGTHLLVVAHREADALPGLTHHLHLDGGRRA
nr:ATP-binding cassette domain-containing protein [Deinococcus wulumuqiensis]